MEEIGKAKIFSFLSGTSKARPVVNSKVRKDPGYFVVDYLNLATRVAELQFLNREHVLLFRGQRNDYTNRRGATSLKPSILRNSGRTSDTTGANLLEGRFNLLRTAERHLVEHFEAQKVLGRERVRRQQVLRWAILQHYEICDTPLLDVTQSLRIAASFASLNNEQTGYVYVMGVPQVSGAVTASAEAGLQNLRLSSVCPPNALRPHVQEGYLLGEYPEIADHEQARSYELYETDFGLRLIAKFQLHLLKFWRRDGFPKVGHRALFPDSDDPFFEFAAKIRDKLSN